MINATSIIGSAFVSPLPK